MIIASPAGQPAQCDVSLAQGLWIGEVPMKQTRKMSDHDRESGWLLIALGVVVGVAVASPDAHAQYWSLNGTGAVSTAVTDNANNAPEESDDPNIAGAEGSFYTTVSPALLFSMETPRTVHVSSLSLSYVEYFGTDAVPGSLNSTLNHSSLFRTSRATEVDVGVNAGLGQVSAVTTTATATPTGNTDFRQVGANQGFRWDLARDWRLSQSATFTQVNTQVEAA
ncbi:MAG: hypothetical protein AAGC55_16985, partial [Myxococcota bacterium]